MLNLPICPPSPSPYITLNLPRFKFCNIYLLPHNLLHFDKKTNKRAVCSNQNFFFFPPNYLFVYLIGLDCGIGSYVDIQNRALNFSQNGDRTGSSCPIDIWAADSIEAPHQQLCRLAGCLRESGLMNQSFCRCWEGGGRLRLFSRRLLQNEKETQQRPLSLPARCTAELGWQRPSQLKSC